MIICSNTLKLIVAGAVGALARDVFDDNKLVLPKFEGNTIVLGFVGGMVVGAIAGYVVDNNPLTACLGGFTGYQVLKSLISQDSVK